MTPDADLYLAPETRCARWGHVFVAHDLLGQACARCGKSADPVDANLPVREHEGTDRRRIHDPGVHKPYNDDGAEYCGWAGDDGIHNGCGEAWPCSADPLLPEVN